MAMVATAPAGIWLGATEALGRPVPVDEPYPHIHNTRLRSGQLVQRRECAACPVTPAKASGPKP